MIESLINDILKSHNKKNHSTYIALVEMKKQLEHDEMAPDNEVKKYETKKTNVYSKEKASTLRNELQNIKNSTAN